MKKEVKVNYKKVNPFIILVLGIVLLVLLSIVFLQLMSNSNRNAELTGNVVYARTTQVGGMNIAVYAKVAPDGEGKWYIRALNGSQQLFDFGWGETSAAGIRYIPKSSLSYKDYSLVGDFDGDGKSDLAVGTYKLEQPNHAGTLFVKYSSNGEVVNFTGGWPGLIPIFADYDGDNKTDVALYAPVVLDPRDNVTQIAQAMWYIKYSSIQAWRNYSWGWNGVIPVPADYDGDNIDDVAVYYPNGTWYISQSRDGFIVRNYGYIGLKVNPVPADYDGDKKADLAIYDAPNAKWYIQPSSGGDAIILDWGYDGPYVVKGDYNGDKKDDLVLYDANLGRWYARNLTATFSNIDYGYSAAVPILGYFEGVNWGGSFDVPASSCNDSDGGLNYNVSGEVSYIGGGAIDLCDYQTKTILSERICNASNTGVTTITYTCPFGCSHGACLISANCTDRDGDGFNASQVGCGISYDCNDSNSSIKPGAMEICGNNKDDNCNLIADEGCSGCTPGTNRTCLGSSVGICSPGIQMCNATGYWGSACYNPVDPANETCNNLDDNCNGVVDDIVPVSCGTLTSSLNGIGRCRQGLTSCINGSSICNGEVLPAIKEICTNGIDDDCNNRTDESSCTICSGCMQDDKCYDYGFRMNISGVGKYCNSQGVFSNQKLVNASCEDNYECKSNFCGEGKCINFVTEVREQASVLWRILCWLMNPLDESDRAQCNIDHTTSSA